MKQKFEDLLAGEVCTSLINEAGEGVRAMSEAKPTGGPRFGDPPEVSKNWIYKAGVGWTWIEPKGEETLVEPRLEKLKNAHKPTEAVIQDATNANLAVAARLERDGEVHYLSKAAPQFNGALSSEDSNPERYRDRLREYQRSIERAERVVALMLIALRRWRMEERKEPKQ